MPRALVIEDEANIRVLVTLHLSLNGVDTDATGHGQEALELARDRAYDLVVLDLMLPGLDGLDVCRCLRQDALLKDIPIIMLTARVEETDKLIGLELGADDYITKPFSPRELVARVRAVLRRAGGESSTAELIRVADLTLDRARYKVTLPGREVTLTPTEFEILATLAGRPGRIFSRAQLLTATRGVSFESYERAIDSHVRNLRRKIEPKNAPKYIITVHGVGYKFAEEAQQ